MFATSFYNWILPRQCIFCGSPLRQQLAICVPCFNDLPILPHHCPCCARFIPSACLTALCGQCLREPPAFRKIYALFPYEPPIIHLILKLKFSQRLHYAQVFGELLAERICLEWYADKPLPDLLIPVPLSSSRMRERGFNQALEIARPIAKRLSLQIDTSLERTKTTLAQTSLKAQERKRNLRNAFASLRDYTDLHVAIIDDVVTTGATIAALTKTLVASGAACVDIWAVARRG